jgi:hypothetical protein
MFSKVAWQPVVIRLDDVHMVDELDGQIKIKT